MARPVHFEIHGDDPEGAAAFYARAFGWTVERWGDQAYWLLGTGEGSGIDGATTPSEEHGQKVVLTVQVDDLDIAVAKVRAAGGTIVLERAPIPGVGDLAQALDPGGVLFGMLQPAPHEHEHGHDHDHDHDH